MIKEEILNKLFKDKWDVSARGYLGGNLWPIVLTAMQEYADQQSAEKDTQLKDLHQQLSSLKEQVRQLNAGMIHFSTLDNMPTLELLDRQGVIDHVVNIGKNKIL